MIQVISELGECDELSLPHFPFGLLHENALFWAKYVVRIDPAPGLNEHAIPLFGECNKVPLLDVKGFEHLPRNDDLTPLAHATDPLMGSG
jgi:hypothetical protein